MDVKTSFELLKSLKALKDLKDAIDAEEESRGRRCWVNSFLERRPVHSLEAHILKGVLWETNDYKRFCRLNVDTFESLLSMLESKIKKQDTVMRDAIPSRTRLALTLRYLATGDSYKSLELLTRVSRKTISKIVPEVLSAIISTLSGNYLKMPTKQTDWKTISFDFNRLWQFPHTLGAIDGKHVRIKRPPHTGSDLLNYKGHHSIVLLAVVDAHSRFLYIDVGGNERTSDVDIFKNSSLYHDLKTGILDLPPDEALPGQSVKTSYFFIGNDIIDIDRNLLKAYNQSMRLTTSEEIFNYRLSRARMPVEMAFGRLASRFRIFNRPIEVDPKTCELVVTASCVLHNMLSENTITDAQVAILPDLPSTMTALHTQQQETKRVTNETRENVNKYLVTNGDIPCQWQEIKKQSANPVHVKIK